MPYSYEQSANSLGDVPNGSWYSDQTQISTNTNTEYIMTVNNTEFERDIFVVDGSKFKVLRAGLYNLMFSTQIYNSDGGGNTAAMEIWLKKNGTTIPYTGGRLSVTPNHPYALAAWNYYVQLAANDYVQLAWDVNTAGINLLQNTAIVPGSEIPSVIVTMTQVG